MTIADLEDRLKRVEAHIDQVDNSCQDRLVGVKKDHVHSAKNLLCYLALRSVDIREIQSRLVSYGISSLGTGAGYVRENISRSLKLLSLIQGNAVHADLIVPSSGHEASEGLLRFRSSQLLGLSGCKTRTQIMVTMPDEVAGDVSLLEQYLIAGMDIVRINLSHGDFHLWDKMLESLAEADNRLSIDTAVFMDLPGPKIRVDHIFAISKNKNGHEPTKSVLLSNKEYLQLMKHEDFLSLKGSDKLLDKIVTVLLPQIIDDLDIGDPIFFDDGAIQGKVTSISDVDAVIKITKATKKKLRTGKGINLPDTHLSLPSLTQNDLELLPYACKNADIIGYSFVRTPGDVRLLYTKLTDIGDSHTGIVLKIETREAFENLPEILIEAMKRQKIGVMIARGDLAVEMGFERISEVKEQIMSICEAAHVPVIWATQVLESMARKGLATRAEISDAVLSGKAECVMLNKGPYMTETIGILKGILGRMGEHRNKNKNTLRSLQVAKNSIIAIQNGLKDRDNKVASLPLSPQDINLSRESKT